MSSEEDKMPLRREDTLAPLEKVPEGLIDKVVEHAEAKRVADLPIIERVKEGIEDVTTQISSQVETLKEAVTSPTDKQEENIKQTQEKPEKKESPKIQKKSNDPNLELKHKLESGEKIKASELASEFIHFIQEESQGSGDQDLKKQEQKGEAKHEHQSLVHIAEEGVKTIVRRLSQTIEDMKEKLHSSREGSATSPDEQHPHHHSLKEFALDFVHEIKDEMTLEYDQEYMRKTKPHGKILEKKLEKFIPHTKPQVETEAETQPLKADEIAPTHQVNPAELKGFTTVQSGKSESESKPQQEEKETKKEDQTLLTSSKNPFDILMEGENLNVVAGEGIGADITNKAPENEPSSFKEKAKAKEKIENVSSKISNKMHAAKSKASDTFKEADKENAPQVA